MYSKSSASGKKARTRELQVFLKHQSSLNTSLRIISVRCSRGQKALPISKTAAKAAVNTTLQLLGLSCDEISIHFVGKKEISALHSLYFEDPTPTDTISFPIDPHTSTAGYRYLGEVFVCPAVAVEYAEKHGLDPYLETTLYLVHGILHLAGYDDLNPKDKKRMRAQEKRCIKALLAAHATLCP